MGYDVKKFTGILQLLVYVRAGDDKEVLIITVLADAEGVPDDIGKFPIKDAGFDVVLLKIGDHAGMFLKIHPIQCQQRPYRVKDRIVGAVRAIGVKSII